jgi:hypothetical protein
VIELFTPRYFPSKPCGILLKNITELAILKTENAITIKHTEITDTMKIPIPNMKGMTSPAMRTAIILGAYAINMARSSPSLVINFGATKKIAIITDVCIAYIKNTVESVKLKYFRNGVNAVK